MIDNHIDNCLYCFIGIIETVEKLDKEINLLITNLKSNDVETRRDAAWKIKEFAETNARDLQDIIPFLVEALLNDDWVIRKMVLLALGKLEAKSECSKVISILNNDKNGEVRAAAAEILTHMEIEEAIPYLIKALKDSERVVFEVAIWGLGSFGEKAKAAVPMLIELLSIKTKGIVSINALAAWALGEIGDTSAIEPLTQALKKVTFLEEQFKIAFAIAQLEEGIGFGTEELQQLQTSGKLMQPDVDLIDELIQSKMK